MKVSWNAHVKPKWSSNTAGGNSHESNSYRALNKVSIPELDTSWENARINCREYSLQLTQPI
jgi:hypothetical protein